MIAHAVEDLTVGDAGLFPEEAEAAFRMADIPVVVAAEQDLAHVVEQRARDDLPVFCFQNNLSLLSVLRSAPVRPESGLSPAPTRTL